MIQQIETEEDVEILRNLDDAYRRGEITLDELTHLRTLVVKGECVVMEGQ